MPSIDRKSRRGPLAGLRIVEMAGLGPAPLAGQLLADLGADVIVVARKAAPADRFDVNARGKRSIALNLKKPEGVAACLRLVERADVLIEGFRPGVMEKLGLGPEVALTANPRLVYGRMTGWGQTGPLAQTAGHDINYLAITGALHAMGRAGAPPMPPLNLVADYGGGAMFLIFGILAALFERQTSGKGQVVDAAMTDGVPALMGLLHGFVASGFWKPERQSNWLDGGAPFYGCYETRDGKYLSVGPLEPQFFAELVDKADLPRDHCASQNDRDTWPQRRLDYAAVFKTRTRDEWLAIFEGSDACVAPVLGWEEAANHLHNRARGTFVRIDGVMQAAPAPRFSRSPVDAPAGPQATGAAGEDILTEAGFSALEIETLKAQSALY